MTSAPVRPRGGIPLGRRLLALLAMGLAACTVWGAPATVARGPAPAWVQSVPVPPSRTAPEPGGSGDVRYLLVDDQLRFEGAQRTEYRRVVSQALGPQGIEQIGNLKFEFDPEYQSLTLHHLTVRRGERVVSQLESARVKVLQREDGLDALMFDGRLTASVVLDDIREGDVVDYAFSRQGANPVFGGRHLGALDMQWGVPVAHRHARLIWPAGRPLHWQRLRGAATPSVSTQGSETVYAWSLRDVPALITEADTPAWHDPFPWVQYSEFADWAAVVAWALPLYEPPAPPGPLLQQELARLRRAGDTPAQRLQATLRFVQDEVRYLGFEIGANSHRPHDPDWVLRRRFGDCKDKTLLALSLLRGLGFEAHAALVHTSWRQGVGSTQASPGVFNHVLLRVRLDGETYWLDPTRTGQGGSRPADWVQADHGLALPIDPAARGLVPMAGPAARTLSREVHAVLDLRGGRDRDAKLTVTTLATGAAAEQLRSAVVSTGRAKLEKQYESFYARSYPGLALDGALKVQDDRASNRLTLVERYRIPRYWRLNEAKGRFDGQVEVPDLDEQTRGPSTAARRDPLGLGTRLKLQLHTEVKLPPGWRIPAEDHEVKGDAFRWTRSVRHADDTLSLKDDFLSTADEVPVHRVAAHAEQLQQVRKQSGMALYDNEGAPPPKETAAAEGASAVAPPAPEPETRPGDDGPHWVPAVLVTLTLGIAAWGTAWVWRWDPAPRTLDAVSAPVGLGGWLLLALLMLVASALRHLHALWDGRSAYTHAAWENLWAQHASETLSPWLLPFLALSLVAVLGLVLALTLSAALVLRRRSAAVPVAIATLLGVAGLGLAERAATATIPLLQAAETSTEAWQAWRGIGVALLWAAYFARSQRVRATLVRRHRPPAAAPDDPGESVATAVPQPSAGG